MLSIYVLLHIPAIVAENIAQVQEHLCFQSANYDSPFPGTMDLSIDKATQYA